MAKIKIVLDTQNIGKLLKSEDTAAMLKKVAESKSGEWETDTKQMGSRQIASIYTTDRKQIREELDSHRIVGGLQ